MSNMGFSDQAGSLNRLSRASPSDAGGGGMQGRVVADHRDEVLPSVHLHVGQAQMDRHRAAVAVSGVVSTTSGAAAPMAAASGEVPIVGTDVSCGPR